MNGTRLYEDDDDMIRQAELFVNFKPDKMVPAINTVWDIYGSRFDLSGISRPDNYPHWKIQALQMLTIFNTNLMFQTKHINEDNMLKLMFFGPRNAQGAQWQALNFLTMARRLCKGKLIDPRVYFGTRASHLTETATNSLYKFEVPGEENHG